MSKTPDFKDRYVVGAGYPWAVGIREYREIQMRDRQIGGAATKFDWPAELWDKEVPRYRLVLERIKPVV